jgi:hypothetical protein
MTMWGLSMRSRRGFIIFVLIAVVLIFGAPILIGGLLEGGQPIDAPTVTPQSAIITPEGGVSMRWPGLPKRTLDIVTA